MLLGIALLFCLSAGAARGEVSQYPKGGLLPESDPAPLSSLEGAWMIGDSQTAPFDLMGLLPGMDVEYKIGMSLQLLNRSKAVKFEDRAMRVQEKIALKNPSALYLWLGSNGIDRAGAAYILGDYETLLQTIRGEFPKLRLYCISATPVRAKAMEQYPRYTPAKILEYNQGLLELSEKYGAYYLDFHSLLVGEDGYLRIEYAAGDGIHMTYKTYELLKDYILCHMADPSNGKEPN